MMKSLYLLGLIAGAILPATASAHVKWFVETDKVINSTHGLIPFYGWSSAEVLIWSCIVLAVVFVFSRVDRIVKTPRVLLAFGLKHEKGINRIAQAVLGAFLITVSLLWNVIIVPDLEATGGLLTVLKYAQMLIGVMYVFNIKPRIASVGLALFCFGLIFSNGFITFLENAILLSLALYFFIIHAKAGTRVARLNRWALEFVRIGTGISLITLAFTEKLMYPELSLQFLQEHNWNFMQPLFPWFTDKLFVLSTGFAEIIFGILFIMGYLTRITTVLIAIFFASSVTTMLIQSGLWEVEDLVVYAAAILFIFHGHGKTKFFHFKSQRG